MDRSLRKNVMLGLFVIAGMVLFIAGIFLIGSKNEIFNKTFPITAVFSNATGLKAGSNVRYNGVKVGIVGSVSLVNDTTVRVGMQIEESKRGYIMNTAIASIASDGLMGDKIVNITNGGNAGQKIANNEVIRSHDPLVTDRVLQTLSTTNDNVKTISENLKKLTTDLNSENGTIQALYKDEGMAQQLRRSFSNLEQITRKVSLAGSSLQEITSQIESGHGLAGELLTDTAMGRELTYTMNNLKKTSEQLTRVSDRFSETVQRATTGKGTVSMLLTDTALSATIQQSMANIKVASEKLDSNMEALKHNFLTRGYFRKLEKKNKR